ncbi:hypothetical protein CUV01_03095 [Paracoccus tegillarcae]|uniref:Acyltransferase 3 domain-containing protein n=2 Tax=Paracoccus tegillarcae TaxID=1529068 RepID=A0A2K9EC60_9RHOB|nr:hypothetical protein CUV01_03095 [Paracoccus tegillarcae]
MPETVHKNRPVLSSELPMETVRAIAIIALVSFHVIGGGEGGGLDVGYPHPLRYYADLMVDVRMPLFAFIAGAVYALKPVEPADLGRFMTGKLRRLALPGLVAISVFLIFATVLGTDDALGGPLWEPYLRSYSIFWFLQAILLIFVFYGTADVLSGGRVLYPALAASALAAALGLRIPTEVMSAHRVTTLLVYFLLGVAIMRNLHQLLQRRWMIVAVAMVAVAIGLTMNLANLSRTGELSANRLDLQSLAFGTGLCVAAFLALPVVGWLRWLGAFSLTIYLYHILATSAARRAMVALDIDSLWLQAAIGTLAGIAFPIVLHLLALRTGPTRLMLLGLRPGARNRQTVRAAAA